MTARAIELDDAETSYRRGCRALVLATRDEVAATGARREALSLVVETLARECAERWRRVEALSAEPIPYRPTGLDELPIPYRLASARDGE